MRTVWIFATVVGLGASGPAAALETPVSVQQTAAKLIDAVRGDDRAAAEALCVDPAEFAALSKRASAAPRLRDRQRAFLRQLGRELRSGVQLERLELKDVLWLPAGVKTRQAVVMAVFHLSLRLPGRDPAQPVVTPMLFLLVDGGWKFYLRD